MSRRPQNGPSFSKAPPKKKKPLSDEELAERQTKERKREEHFREKAEGAKRFSKAVKAFGGSIPLRGPGAGTFFKMLEKPDDPKQSERFIEAAKKAEADETKSGADKAFKGVTAKRKKR